MRDLRRLIERSGLFRWTLHGVGRIEGAKLSPRGLGPIARASGVMDDARTQDPAYQAVSFSPIVQQAPLKGDASARWRQRFDEIEQSLTIADLAGELHTGGRTPIEGPRGPVYADAPAAHAALELIPEVLRGIEWGDAVTTIVSLDLGHAYSVTSASKDNITGRND